MNTNRYLAGAVIVLAVAAVVLDRRGGRHGMVDRVSRVDENDSEMAVAIAAAREKLPEFWQAFDANSGRETDFAIKVKIADSNGVEFFWATDLERRDGMVYGTINNDPETVKSVRFGQRMEIPDELISDWMYVRDEKIVGNYTLRALFKTMTPEEVQAAKEMLAEP